MRVGSSSSISSAASGRRTAGRNVSFSSGDVGSMFRAGSGTGLLPTASQLTTEPLSPHAEEPEVKAGRAPLGFGIRRTLAKRQLSLLPMRIVVSSGKGYPALPCSSGIQLVESAAKSGVCLLMQATLRP